MVFSLSTMASSDQVDDTMPKIETLAKSSAGKTDQTLVEDVIERIETDPANVSDKLISRLKDKNSTENQLAVYVWALGHTKDQSAVERLTQLYQENKSEIVKGNCLRALAMIGGQKAGEFILSTLDATSDKQMRFTLLNLLGQMQYERALPKTEEILRADPQQFYWQPIFVFGKMGDKAIPFLLTKISDKDRNVRANAINVLGQWLIAPEAAKPIEKQFWKENDKRLRELELSSLEKTIPDLAGLKSTFEQVTANEKDADLVKFAREAIDMINQSKFTSMADRKHISAESFQKEYTQLFKSAGKKGNYEILANSSSVNDEPKLKALRERILQKRLRRSLLFLPEGKRYNYFESVSEEMTSSEAIQRTPFSCC